MTTQTKTATKPKGDHRIFWSSGILGLAAGVIAGHWLPHGLIVCGLGATLGGILIRHSSLYGRESLIVSASIYVNFCVVGIVFGDGLGIWHDYLHHAYDSGQFLMYLVLAYGMTFFLYLLGFRIRALLPIQPDPNTTQVYRHNRPAGSAKEQVVRALVHPLSLGLVAGVCYAMATPFGWLFAGVIAVISGMVIENERFRQSAVERGSLFGVNVLFVFAAVAGVWTGTMFALPGIGLVTQGVLPITLIGPLLQWLGIGLRSALP